MIIYNMLGLFSISSSKNSCLFWPRGIKVSPLGSFGEGSKRFTETKNLKKKKKKKIEQKKKKKIRTNTHTHSTAGAKNRKPPYRSKNGMGVSYSFAGPGI
jgi:UDP-N-acetylglucosamine pyrophosphorylase